MDGSGGEDQSATAGRGRLTLEKSGARWAAAMLVSACGVLVALVLGLSTTVAPAIALSLLPLGFVTFLIVGPRLLFLIYVFITFSGLDLFRVAVGPVDFGTHDLVFGGLAFVAIETSLRQTAHSSPILRQLGSVLGAFLLYVGLTVIHLIHISEGAVGDSLVSWARLVQTLVVVPFVPYFVRTRKDLAWVAIAAIAGVFLSFTVAVRQSLVEPLEASWIPTRRYGGLLNQNQFGLVSAIAMVLSLFGRRLLHPLVRIGGLVVGAAGLFYARSLSSGAALFAALILGAVYLGKQRHVSLIAARLVVVSALVGILAFTYTTQLRPEEVPGSDVAGESSTEVRAMLARAGWEVFWDHPFIGVGWQGSSLPQVIGAKDVSAVLRYEFPDLPPAYYPDVTPTSVHNAYVQILAELGIVGAFLFLLTLFHGHRSIRATPTWDRHTRRLWVTVVVMILVWWNTNPIFGGQAESMALAIALGMIVATSVESSRATSWVD